MPIKEFLDKSIEAEKQKKLNAIMQIAGTVSINPKYNNMTAKELRRVRAEKYRK